MIELPLPQETAKAHSQQLVNQIKAMICAQNGWISFADYMQTALYLPNFGYYDQNLSKIGAQGDFVTAPELSPLFAQCLSHYCQPILAELGPSAVILEFGAGSGRLAADLLQNLSTTDCLPAQYAIVELSTDLKHRQVQTIASLPKALADKVIWLDKLPETPIQGIILANEVIDAMPVHRFELKDDLCRELGVGLTQENLALQSRDCQNEALHKAVHALELPKGSEPYCSEVNLLAPAWIKTISQQLQRGVALIIDYGFPQAEYYHWQRRQGTLMCHYQHRAHSDPFFYPGLQDITAHVNFSQLAYCARQQGMTIAGFSTQALFLLAQGIDTMQSITDLASQLQHSQQIQTLTNPSEMGELFKVLALSQGMVSLPKFSLRDNRGRL